MFADSENPLFNETVAFMKSEAMVIFILQLIYITEMHPFKLIFPK